MSKTIKISLVHSLLLVIYVGIIGYIIQNGEKLFGQVNSVLSTVGFLLLLVTSAAICGYLIFGKPILMYIDNEKKEAVKLLTYTLASISIITVLVLVILAV